MPTKKSTKYIDLISQSVADCDKEQKGFANDDAKLHCDSAILETKKALSTAKKVLSDSEKAEPFNLQEQINATIAVQDLEISLKLAEKITAEKF